MEGMNELTQVQLAALVHDFPLRVMTPQSMSRRLLLYTTPEEGTRALMTHSTDSMRDAVLRLTSNDDRKSLKLNAYFLMHTVKPTLHLREAYAANALQRDVERFKEHLWTRLRQAGVKMGRPAITERLGYGLDKVLQPCCFYKSRVEHEEQYDLSHLTCVNCIGGWVPRKQTVLQCYYEHRGLMPALAQLKGASTPDDCPEAVPTDTIYAMVQDFGAHARGHVAVSIEPGPEAAKLFFKEYDHHEITFFFQGWKMPLKPLVSAQRKGWRLAQQEEAERVSSFNASVKEEKKQAARELAIIFGTKQKS